MKIRFKLEILNVLLGFAALVTPLFAQDPVVSVTVKNLETLGEKLPAMAEDAGDQGLGIAALTFQSFISQPSFTEAIDPARPVGLFLIPTGEKFPSSVAVIPVKDAEKALKLLPAAKFVTEKKGENFWEVSKKAEEGEAQKVLARVEQQGDWCFVQHAQTGISVKDAGQKLVQALTAPKDSEFQFTFNVNAVPQKDRQKFVMEAKARIEKDLKADGVKKLGKEATDFFLCKLEEFVADAESHNWESPLQQITWGYTWDVDAHKLVIRNAFTGCKDAHQIQDLSAAVAANASALNGFGTEGSVASYYVNARIDGLNDAAFEELLSIRRNECVKHVEKKWGEETAKEVSEWLTKNQPLFRDAFVGPEQEFAGAVFGERGKSFTFICARSVSDGYALEKTFCQAAKYIGEKKEGKCEKHVKNGKRTENGELHIYQADFRKKLKKELNEIFHGKVPACIVFAPKAVYCAVGTDALEVLQKNIQAAQTADAPAFAARVSLQKALKVCEKVQKASDEKKEKLEKVGDAEATVKAVSREDGVEFVAEVPAQFFKAMKILEKK